MAGVTTSDLEVNRGRPPPMLTSTEESMPIIAQFLAVTWIIFAGLAWFVAKTKARNPWVWVVLGILTGPLAVFVLILLPKVDQEKTA